MQRGGPLVLFLILKRIQDTSESVMKSLKKQVHNMKISALKGENVDTAVSLIKSTHKVPLGASAPDRSYVPDDFNHTVVKVFMTTSVREFNLNFKEIECTVLKEADMTGMKPNWPSVGKLANLATNLYSRTKQENKWDGVKGKTAAFNANKTYCLPVAPSAKTNTKPKHCCWLCGSYNHLLPDCKQPRDEAKIAKNHEAFLKANPCTRPQRRPHRKTDSDGAPLIRNKCGAYVLDQKRIHQAKEAVKLIDTLSQLPDSASTSSTETPAVSVNVARKAQCTAALDRVRSLLAKR